MNPTRILDLASAFWSSAALLSAVELDLFAHLDAGATAAEVATAAGLPERSTAMLLDAFFSATGAPRQAPSFSTAHRWRFARRPAVGAAAARQGPRAATGGVGLLTHRAVLAGAAR